MSRQAHNAVEVVSELLEATGRALITRDFEGFAARFLLPQEIATVDGARLLRTTADLRLTFEEVSAHYAEIGAKRLDRWIEAAFFDGPDTIRCSHATHLLSGDGRLLKAPHTTIDRLRREGGRWWIAGSQFAADAHSDHGRALMSGDAWAGPGPARDRAAGATFQDHLDRVTAAYMEQDADALLTAVQLPLFVQTSRGTMVCTTPRDLRADFQRTVTQMQMHGVTDVVRGVLSAEMVGGRRIHGAYRTHILSGTRLVIPAYKSAMTLEQGEDLTWRMTSVIHPMGHLTLQAGAEAQELGDGGRKP